MDARHHPFDVLFVVLWASTWPEDRIVNTPLLWLIHDSKDEHITFGHGVKS